MNERNSIIDSYFADSIVTYIKKKCLDVFKNKVLSSITDLNKSLESKSPIQNILNQLFTDKNNKPIPFNVNCYILANDSYKIQSFPQTTIPVNSIKAEFDVNLRLNLVYGPNKAIIANIDYIDYIAPPQGQSYQIPIIPKDELLLIFNELLPLLCLKGLYSKYYNLLGIDINTKNNLICNPNTIFGRSLDKYCDSNRTDDSCGCHPTYGKHSDIVKNITSNIKDNIFMNKNRWCYYPACASGKAYKSFLEKERSICPSINYSNIYLDPGNYSNINLKNININSSSANKFNINILPECDSYKYDDKQNKMICKNK